MTNETEMPTLAFSGSAKEQEIASAAFNVLRARGMFMSDNSPIRVLKSQLVEYLTSTVGASEKDIDAAFAANEVVFGTVESADGELFVVTTRDGYAPTEAPEGMSHSLQQRLMTPEPKPEKPAMPVRERVRVDPSWASFQMPQVEEDEEIEEEFEELADLSEPFIEDETVAVEEAKVEPAAETEVVVEKAPEPVVEPEPVVATDVVEEAPVVETEPEPVAVDEVVVEEQPAIVEEKREPEPIVVPEPEPAVTRPTTPAIQPTDLTGYSDEDIAAAVTETLVAAPQALEFGGRWASSDRAHRLSRGDLRRIRDYIDESEQPLTDATLVQDILKVRQDHPEYETALFGLNYWLDRERDFEFVGTRDQPFWSTSNLPPIGTNLRKPNEIGNDYRFLAESIDAESVEHRSVSSVDHVVTFYEWQLGLLPFDEEMQKLFPAPVSHDQRTAVFTFEFPQTYSIYLAELRYPTPNRGGFFLGLDDFYLEQLVPGAIISISATENDGHYKVEYLPASEQSDRLLELDDKRSPRYHYRPTSFACEVDPAWALNEDRFPRLNGERPLADKVRRRNDAVVESTFERIGEDMGDGKSLASFEDLLTAVNIERPFSESLLRQTLEEHASISGDDANGYTYDTEA